MFPWFAVGNSVAWKLHVRLRRCPGRDFSRASTKKKIVAGSAVSLLNFPDDVRTLPSGLS